MTLAPDSPALECRSLTDAVAALRDRGLRLSTARRLVLEALFDADGPVSAEHLTRRLRLEESSVYRNLELLESHGLVRHVHLGHGPGLYALRSHGEREYLYCERCGAVRALAPEELDPVRERVKEQFGYEARFTHFAIVGTCPTCSRDPHTHDHRHDDGTVHEQAHAEHHAEHEHEHSHGDRVHSHPHAHRDGPEDEHQHGHGTEAAG
jgi:Fur family transcriptional regulator, ferric uptake regulator